MTFAMRNIVDQIPLDVFRFHIKPSLRGVTGAQIPAFIKKVKQVVRSDRDQQKELNPNPGDAASAGVTSPEHVDYSDIATQQAVHKLQQLDPS